MNIHKNVLIFSLLFILPLFIKADVEYLDTTFGPDVNGIVTTALSPNTDSQINSVKIQSDGKIIVTGSMTSSSTSQFATARYDSSGKLDAGFGTNGVALLLVDNTSQANDLAIQSNGKIVVTGYSVGSSTQFVTVRYNTDGTVDTGFADNGIASTLIGDGSGAQAVQIQSDGKIVVAGTAVLSGTPVFALVRYNTDGSLDTSFNSTGILTTAIGFSAVINDLVIQSDGKIVAVGFSNSGSNEVTLVRYNSNGSLDTSFNTNGVVTTSVEDGANAHSVVIQSDDKIVISGFTTVSGVNEFLTIRYNTDGSVDTSFNSTGIVITSIGAQSNATSVVLQSDGKIVVAGSSNTSTGQPTFTIVRYNDSDGSLDSTFGVSGILNVEIGSQANANSVDIQSDDRVVVGGFSINTATEKSDFALIRANKNNTDFVNITSPTNHAVITQGRTVSISGTSSAASQQVKVYINDVLFDTVSTDGSGNWDAGTSDVLPLGLNSIRADLIVSSNVIVSHKSVITIVDNLANELVYAYHTASQTVTAASTFIDLDFDTTPELGTWTFSSKTFTCKQPGKYLVTYRGEAGVTGLLLTSLVNISMRAMKNGLEIGGSQSNTEVDTNLNQVKILATSFEVEMDVNDTLKFQVASNTFVSVNTIPGLLAGTGLGTTKPSVSVTIARIL